MPPDSTAWSTVLEDSVVGSLRLTGALSEVPGAEAVVVVVHGLGGGEGSEYAVRAARAVVARGLSCLRLNLRGADGQTGDLYHAGLTADLAATLSSPEVLRYPRRYVLGYSLGGHLALRLLTVPGSPRPDATAAVCSPVDLSACVNAIDAPLAWLYRIYLLVSLRRQYARCCALRDQPVSVARARRIRTIREWDDTIVAPRHGFESAEDYYVRASVGPRLEQLEDRALLVPSEGDPMVPADTIRPWLNGRSTLEVRWTKLGGHVGFPASLDLGLDSEPGLEHQILTWFDRG
jgi:hypothetical protein